ncbi:MAG: Zn-dependent oligopeptidase [Ignavibacteriaceae bacterium]|nr:Zn-dependent oligopeptidase [Ignavibacteriaceae bacterium]
MKKHFFVKPFVYLVLTISQIVTGFSFSQSESGDPLPGKFNQPIQFSNLTPEYIKQATDASINQAKESLDKLYAIPKEKRTFDNTMLELDNIYNNAGNVANSVNLMSNVHPDDAVREQATESNSVFDKFFNSVQLDENLYRAVKDYSESAEAKSLNGYKAKFVEETVRDFERNGFALSKEGRDKLKDINDKISDLSIMFQQNIAKVDDYLIVDDAQIEGLQEDYKNARRTEDGKYKIDLSYPSYRPFMKYSESEETRKELYSMYNNRAAKSNLEVLIKVLMLKKEMAELLGFKTYAEYRVGDRMAKLPQNVWDFENNLVDKLKEKAQIDYDELLMVKRAKIGDETIDVIQPWEGSYYSNILLKEKYDLDQNLVKEYFAADAVFDGLFQIAQHLFGVQFEEVKDPSVWNKDVRMFNVKKDGKVIARFYTDLYPRPNKFSHAACFPMIKGKGTPQGYQMPVATLVCNFPAPTEDIPSLLTHREVETFFHEFGHVLHNMLTTAELSTQSGTSVSRDFVEAPSQIFENWTWNYDALKLFAKNYKTGEVLPPVLFEKMLAAKNVGSGLSNTQQVFYGLIDFTLHDKYDPTSATTTTEIVEELQNKITLYPYLDGTHMQAAFGHLMGYAAGYYGYLWSLVYAQDMFSVFEKNGVMDVETGLRYRDIIFANGGSRDELEMVIEFLGREPNQDAYFKSIGLDVDDSDTM